MRISVLDTDAGYIPIDDTQLYEIFLNEVRQQGVLTADEDQGFVFRYQTDANGDLVVERNEALTETVTGNVRIVKTGR